MNDAILDCTDIQCSRQLHRLLAQKLQFPQWYGNNLDALYDCLTDIRKDTRLILTNFGGLGSFTESFRSTLEDAAAENPHLTVIIC